MASPPGPPVLAAGKVTIWSTLWPMGGVLSGSLLIAWATEVLSFFLSRGLAFAVLALLQVLPEFAVEATITLGAAGDASQLKYVTANFTGANRLIVGLFIPLVFFMAAHRAKRRSQRIDWVDLPKESSIEVMALIVATLYSFTIVLRGRVSLVDAVILVAIYVMYLYLTYHMPPEQEEHHALPLVPRTIRAQPVARQKWIIAAFFLIGGGLLYVSVHPFYVNTLELGAIVGIGGYFLLQWLAPFLSEFPEFITILYWGRTGRAQLGLTNAISSKVNQWTLLIAMIPVVYAYGTWKHGNLLGSLVFDDSQKLEILLTAAQGLFAAAAFLNLRFHRWEALALIVLWGIQLFDPLIDPWLEAQFGALPHYFAPAADEAGNLIPHYVREWTTVAYLILTPLAIFLPKERFAAIVGFKDVWKTLILRGHVTPPPPTTEPPRNP